MGKPMKPHLLDAMGEALSLVRQSNLAEATALLRRALSGEALQGRGSASDGRPLLLPGPAFAPTPRRPLGEVLRALRAKPAMPPGAAPEAEPTHAFGERFLKRVYRGPAGSLSYRLYIPADRERRELALVLMLHGCTQNPEDFALGTRMNDLADEFGPLLLALYQDSMIRTGWPNRAARAT